MIEFLLRRWFLIALVATIAVGHFLGEYGPASVNHALGSIFNGTTKAWINASVLFCMSVTLDGSRLRSTLLSPSPVIWAVFVNVVLIPLAAPLLMPLQGHPDFVVGILIAASVPSTMAAASVWTRRAGGNDAISLLVTLITNAGCVIYTPFWLAKFGTGDIQLNMGDMIQKLLLIALLPTILGQVARWSPPVAKWADRQKTLFGVLAQIGILTIVLTAACDGGQRLAADQASLPGGEPAPSLIALGITIVSCMVLHLGAMAVAAGGARLLRISREDGIAVAFAASQKTLPIGVLVATDPGMYGTAFPWAVFPMLIYHASQLLIDAGIADSLQARTRAQTNVSN